jgi:vitamin B12 transporter
VPGLDLANSGTPGQTTGVFTRGTNTNHTIVTLDGRRLPFDFAGAYDLTNLTLDNVERIEVLRGPSSSVYGGNALGGVINLVSKSGKGLERPTADVSFEGGSYGYRKEGVSAAGAEKSLDYSLQASRTDTDNQRPNNAYRNTSAGGKVGWQAAPELYVDMAFRYALSDAGVPGPVTKPMPTSHFLKETWSVSPGLTWKTTDDWSQQVFFSHNQQRSVATRSTSVFEPNLRAQVDSDQVDYQSDFQVLPLLKITAGGSLEDYRVSRFNNVTNLQDIDSSETRLAGFVQTQWEPLENWNWTGNVRVDHNSDFGDAATFRLGQSYRVPVTQTLVHASYGTAFAPPAPQNTAIAYFGNPDVGAEKSKGYEAGIEQPFWNNRAKVGATWFHNDLNNLIDFDLNTFSLRNIGRAMTEGVETFGEVSPIPELTLKGGYTYLTAMNEITHERLVRRPRHKFTADAVYHPLPSITLTSGVQWVVGREDYDPVSYLQADSEDYTLVRFTAAWEAKKWLQIFGRVENALGEHYAEVSGYPALDTALSAGFKLTY